MKKDETRYLVDATHRYTHKLLNMIASEVNSLLSSLTNPRICEIVCMVPPYVSHEAAVTYGIVRYIDCDNLDTTPHASIIHNTQHAYFLKT